MAICLSEYTIPFAEGIFEDVPDKTTPRSSMAADSTEIPTEQGDPYTPRCSTVDDFSTEMPLALEEQCTPKCSIDDETGSWTPRTEDGCESLEYLDPTCVWSQGAPQGMLMAMPSSEPGYYVPCVVTPVGPPTPNDKPTVVSCLANQSPPAFGSLMVSAPAQNSTENTMVYAAADGAAVMGSETPTGGMCDQWGGVVMGTESQAGDMSWCFLHELQQPMLEPDGGSVGMYFDPTMFLDGCLFTDANGNPFWTTQSRLSHPLVPKITDLRPYGESIDEKSESSGKQPVTTIMIRNIPNRYTRKMLMDELDTLGFKDTYDFIYVPMDRNTHWNVGYAFVNFMEEESATRCMEKLTDYHFSRCQKLGKIAQACPAHIQGLNNNMEYYSNTAVNNSNLQSQRPLVIRKHVVKQQLVEEETDENRLCYNNHVKVPPHSFKSSCKTQHYKGWCGKKGQSRKWVELRCGSAGDSWHWQHSQR